MDAAQWTSRPIEDPERFAKASHQLHSLVQWLARMQRSFGSEGAADAPIRLQWRVSRKAIETLPLSGKLSLELRLPDMVLQFLEDGEAVSHALETEEHSPAHVEAWLLVEMLHRGIERSRFSKALPYDVSRLMSGDSAEFEPEAYAPELETLTVHLVEAADLLAQASGVADAYRTIVVRPDDLSLESIQDGGAVIGFKSSDETRSEPFFYVRQEGEAASQPEAILPVSQIDAAPDGTGVLQFLKNGQASTLH